MPRPLQPEDPTRLGPFRLTARLHESSAGIVYFGVDVSGRAVSVGLLTTSAAGDAAARDRFSSAITGAGRTAGPGDAPILAAQPDGPAPWVATSYVEGQTGAERFFEAVMLRRGWAPTLRRRGPQFQPYWASGASGPALQGEPGSVRPANTRTLAFSVLSLAALLVVLAALSVLLYQCEPKLPDPPPPTPTPIQTVPATPIPAPSDTPASPTPSPSPSPSTPCPTPTRGKSPSPGLDCSNGSPPGPGL
jgi:hypothetical protein